ncbi:MAG: choice-of-anchor B family protein [Bacteroidota bacterium]
MRKRVQILFFCIFFCCAPVFSQLNFDSLSHISYVTLHDTYLNDVWGHVDALGNEYALVGARKGVSVVDVTVPGNPQEVYWIDGTESVWRDVNTWNNYAYITTEAESGLLILDLSNLPDAAGITSHYYTGPAGSEWQSAHTLFVDSAGYAYIFGANRGNGGVIILDVHTDPLNPVEVGVFDDWYCHDGYVLGDTMYLAHISEGFISIVDISDRSNPQLLGTKATHNTFSHNIWTTPDGQLAFTTDEVSGAFVGAYDISDPGNITELDLVQSSQGMGVIPHNVHYLDDYLVTSYYSDGVVIFDAQRPGNLVQVANFDTYPGQTTGFNGCWASYPFLPSGIVLAADITEGLFISRPEYHRASYVEGIVTDQSNGNALSGVKIDFQDGIYTEFSRSNGTYATGLGETGSHNLTFFKVGYYPQTIAVNLAEGQVTNLDVALIPIPKYNLKILVKDGETNAEIFDAHIRLTGSLTEDELLTNGLGEADFQLYYEESYHITIGKWGYRLNCFDQSLASATGTLLVYLHPGYEDDFSLDFGWSTAFIGATAGYWERAKPKASTINSAPGLDAGEDCGDQAFVTGNSENPTPDFDDVKKGMVLLYSPVFDLSGGDMPYIHYERWFYNYYGTQPYDDSLKIFISNGDSTVLLDYQHSDTTTFFHWNKKSFFLPDYIALSENMQLVVKLSDYDPGVNVTEGGLDHFFMDSYDHFKIIEDTLITELQVFPNPFTDKLEIRIPDGMSMETRVYDNQGHDILRRLLNPGSHQLDLAAFSGGVYFVRIGEQVFKVIKM